MKTELDRIKKKYGEAMSHYCRDNFSKLLEHNDRLYNILLNSFAPNKCLFYDLESNNKLSDFNTFIMSQNIEDSYHCNSDKSPQELLSIKGYKLYECKTEKEINKFKKYYTKDEMLCTFGSDRLNHCYVFFAVKDKASKLRRKNFKNPKREDAYGVSVLSIQFAKGEYNIISIKNRYNHRVFNPDATFSNNLDNIIPGLTSSFEKYYGFNLKYDRNELEIPNYVKANDGRFYKYNYEINGIYYCVDNVIINNGELVLDYKDKSKYLVIDYYVFDLVNKKVFLYDNRISDSFINDFNDISKISVSKNNGFKTIQLQSNDELIEIIIDNNHRMIRYQNNVVETISDNYMMYNLYLKSLELFTTKSIGSSFLKSNRLLEDIYTPNVITIKESFLLNNESLEEIFLPNVTALNEFFMFKNEKLKTIYIPKVKYIYDHVLSKNMSLEHIYLPDVVEIGDNFLFSNQTLKNIEAPSLNRIKNNFLFSNVGLKNIEFPKLTNVGVAFLNCNRLIKSVYLPELIRAEEKFLNGNIALTELYLPQLQYAGDCFLQDNVVLKRLYIPNCTYMGECCFFNNQQLKEWKINKNLCTGLFFLPSNFNYSHNEVDKSRVLKRR